MKCLALLAAGAFALLACGSQQPAALPATTTTTEATTTTTAPLQPRLDQCSAAANSAKDATVAFLNATPGFVLKHPTPAEAAAASREAAKTATDSIEAARKVCADALTPECPTAADALFDYMIDSVKSADISDVIESGATPTTAHDPTATPPQIRCSP